MEFLFRMVPGLLLMPPEVTVTVSGPVSGGRDKVTESGGLTAVVDVVSGIEIERRLEAEMEVVSGKDIEVRFGSERFAIWTDIASGKELDSGRLRFLSVWLNLVSSG
jgi:hypothetical protein